jgi:hypothetical protein
MRATTAPYRRQLCMPSHPTDQQISTKLQLERTIGSLLEKVINKRLSVLCLKLITSTHQDFIRPAMSKRTTGCGSNTSIMQVSEPTGPIGREHY